jgi:hypothetical protein
VCIPGQAGTRGTFHSGDIGETARAEGIEIGCDTATIVTLHEENTIKTTSGTVRVQPLWRWALAPPANSANPALNG